jgi:hypothetical protein
MFYQLLFIHLYRPFLKYTKSTSPLPSHVSPRRLCTQAAAAISKLLRIYKRSYGLRQICNIAVYIVHSACTIHLLNLPERNAKRDLIHGLRNLEEISEGWLCARRTLRILDMSASKWRVKLPNEAMAVFERAHTKWGSWGSWDHGSSPSSTMEDSPVMQKSILASISCSASGDRAASAQIPQQQQQQHHHQHLVNQQNTNLALYPVPAFQPALFANVPPTYNAGSDRQAFGNFTPHPQMSPPDPRYLAGGPRMVFQQGNTVQQPQSDKRNLNQEVSCDNSNSSNSPAAVSGTPPMPVFNGIADNLIEESQDWWLQDQSALALGLENWGEGWAGNQFVSGSGDGEMRSQPQGNATIPNLQSIPQGPNMRFTLSESVQDANRPRYGQ